MKSLAIALVAGQLVGLLGWVDPLFVPLILLGPTVTGAAVAWQRGPAWFAPVLWASAGLNMLWTDWLVNREDVVFHLGVAVLTAVLAAGRLVRRTRGRHPRAPRGAADADGRILTAGVASGGGGS